MRTHKKHGVLLAGINGHKIYVSGNTYRIVARYGFRDVPQEKENIVCRYVNLKYYPSELSEKITSDFLDLVEGLI